MAMGPIIYGNVFNKLFNDKNASLKNYKSIGHLDGSIKLNSKDKNAAFNLTNICNGTDKNSFDYVKHVSEKIDGTNVGVIKKNDLLYPVTKNGYDARVTRQFFPDDPNFKTQYNNWALFAKWVFNKSLLLNTILSNNERLVFEWCAMTQSIKYSFKTQPIVLLDKVNCITNKRATWEELDKIKYLFGIPRPKLLMSTIGPLFTHSENVEEYIKRFGNGFAGAKSPMEGIVIRLERDNEFVGACKYVAVGSPVERSKDYFVIRNDKSNLNVFKDFTPFLSNKDIENLYGDLFFRMGK